MKAKKKGGDMQKWDSFYPSIKILLGQQDEKLESNIDKGNDILQRNK